MAQPTTPTTDDILLKLESNSDQAVEQLQKVTELLQQLGEQTRRSADATKDLNRNVQDLDTGFSRLQRAVVVLNQGLELAAKGAHALDKVFDVLIRRQIEAARTFASWSQEITNSARALGVSNEFYQVLIKRTQELSGSSREGARALQAITNAIEQAQYYGSRMERQFHQIGVQLTDSSGQFRGIETITKDVAVAFTKMTSETQRAQLALRFFPEGGPAVIEVLRALALSSGKAGDEMGIIGDRAMEMGVRLARAEEQLRRNREAGERLGAAVRAQMLAPFAELQVVFSNLVRDIREYLTPAIALITKGISTFALAITGYAVPALIAWIARLVATRRVIEYIVMKSLALFTGGLTGVTAQVILTTQTLEILHKWFMRHREMAVLGPVFEALALKLASLARWAGYANVAFHGFLLGMSRFLTVAAPWLALLGLMAGAWFTFRDAASEAVKTMDERLREHDPTARLEAWKSKLEDLNKLLENMGKKPIEVKPPTMEELAGRPVEQPVSLWDFIRRSGQYGKPGEEEYRKGVKEAEEQLRTTLPPTEGHKHRMGVIGDRLQMAGDRAALALAALNQSQIATIEQQAMLDINEMRMAESRAIKEQVLQTPGGTEETLNPEIVAEIRAEYAAKILSIEQKANADIEVELERHNKRMRELRINEPVRQLQQELELERQRDAQLREKREISQEEFVDRETERALRANTAQQEALRQRRETEVEPGVREEITAELAELERQRTVITEQGITARQQARQEDLQQSAAAQREQLQREQIAEKQRIAIAGERDDALVALHKITTAELIQREADRADRLIELELELARKEVEIAKGTSDELDDIRAERHVEELESKRNVQREAVAARLLQDEHSRQEREQALRDRVESLTTQAFGSEEQQRMVALAQQYKDMVQALREAGLESEIDKVTAAFNRMAEEARAGFVDMTRDFQQMLAATFAGEKPKDVLDAFVKLMKRRVEEGFAEALVEKSGFDLSFQTNFLETLPGFVQEGMGKIGNMIGSVFGIRQKMTFDSSGMGSFPNVPTSGGAIMAAPSGAPIVMNTAGGVATTITPYASSSTAGGLQPSPILGSGNVSGPQSYGGLLGGTLVGEGATGYGVPMQQVAQGASIGSGGGFLGSGAGQALGAIPWVGIVLTAIDSLLKGVKAAEAKSWERGATQADVMWAGGSQFPVIGQLGELIGQKTAAKIWEHQQRLQLTLGSFGLAGYGPLDMFGMFQPKTAGTINRKEALSLVSNANVPRVSELLGKGDQGQKNEVFWLDNETAQKFEQATGIKTNTIDYADPWTGHVDYDTLQTESPEYYSLAKKNVKPGVVSEQTGVVRGAFALASLTSMNDDDMIFKLGTWNAQFQALGLSAEETRRQLQKMYDAANITWASGIDEIQRKGAEGTRSVEALAQEIDDLAYITLGDAPAGLDTYAIAMKHVYEEGDRAMVNVANLNKEMEQQYRLFEGFQSQLGGGVAGVVQGLFMGKDFKAKDIDKTLRASVRDAVMGGIVQGITDGMTKDNPAFVAMQEALGDVFKAIFEEGGDVAGAMAALSAATEDWKAHLEANWETIKGIADTYKDLREEMERADDITRTATVEMIRALRLETQKMREEREKEEAQERYLRLEEGKRIESLDAAIARAKIFGDEVTAAQLEAEKYSIQIAQNARQMAEDVLTPEEAFLQSLKESIAQTIIDAFTESLIETAIVKQAIQPLLDVIEDADLAGMTDEQYAAWKRDVYDPAEAAANQRIATATPRVLGLASRIPGLVEPWGVTPEPISESNQGKNLIPLAMTEGSNIHIWDLIGSVASGKNIPAMAEGGIVTSPTFALLGEKGAEAVIPLANALAGGATSIADLVGGVAKRLQLQSMMTTAMSGLGTFGRLGALSKEIGCGGTPTIVVNVTGNTLFDFDDARRLADLIGSELSSRLRFQQPMGY